MACEHTFTAAVEQEGLPDQHVCSKCSTAFVEVDEWLEAMQKAEMLADMAGDILYRFHQRVIGIPGPPPADGLYMYGTDEEHEHLFREETGKCELCGAPKYLGG